MNFKEKNELYENIKERECEERLHEDDPEERELWSALKSGRISTISKILHGDPRFRHGRGEC